MKELVELGTVSARGQIAIPAPIRNALHLEEGSKVLFVVADDILLLRKVQAKTFAEITKPFKEAAKKMGLQEKDAADWVHAARKK